MLAAHPAAAAACAGAFGGCLQRTDGGVARLGNPLAAHAARRLASGEPLTIVAVGSSSTAGAGASSPAASYPSRLAVELQAAFPGA